MRRHDELGGGLLAALVLLLAIAGCGSVTAGADAGDGGLDQGGAGDELGGRGGTSAGGGRGGGMGGAAGAGGELAGRGGTGGGGAAGGAAGCTGCMSGGGCIAPSQQTDDMCGTAGAACRPTMLSCMGVQGACAQGDQIAVRSVCGSAVTYKVCCPVAACVPDQCYRCMQAGLPCP